MRSAESRVLGSSECPSTLQPRLLFLPRTGHDYADGSRPAYLLEPSDTEPDGYALHGSVAVEPGRLFWYRWIVGHQVSFILWRLIGDVIKRSSGDLPTPQDLDLLAACVDSYSFVVLYSATVPRDQYHADTRARMALQHPSFSGTWAPDYRPIRRFFRGGYPWQGDPSCAALGSAIALTNQTHDYIAGHLVPDGRSLWQESVGSSGPSVSREREDLFDNFFMTIRRPVSQVEVLGQLMSRLAEVAADLAHHGLYPDVGGVHHPVVDGQSSPTMRLLASDGLRILGRAARLLATADGPLEAARR